MRHGVGRDEQRTPLGQLIDVMGAAGLDDLAERVVLLDHDHDMVGPWHSRLGEPLESKADKQDECEPRQDPPVETQHWSHNVLDFCA